MYLYNSLSHKKELFQPNSPDVVKMYTCGPTVYHFAHIGNLRTYIMEDVLEKALRYQGYNVIRVMNITDVGHLASDADTGEDKMLKGAKRENKSVMEIAQFYTDAFMADCAKLNIAIPEIVQPATGCIPEFIAMVEGLLEKSLRYVGYNVRRVMNITDVGHLASDADTGEDKMLKGAKRENKSVMDIARVEAQTIP